MQKDLEQKVSQLKKEIQTFTKHPDLIIEETAARLEGLNYSPPITTPLADFLRLTSHSLVSEIDRILALPEDEVCARTQETKEKCCDVRFQVISVLIFYYRQLLQLRDGNGEAWDDIDEIYVHD